MAAPVGSVDAHQSLQDQLAVHQVDGIGMAGHHPRQTSGGNYLDLVVGLCHLRLGAADQILHTAHIAPHNANLYLGHRVIALSLIHI